MIESVLSQGCENLENEQNIVIGTYPTEDFDLDRLAEACLICQPTAFIRRSAIDMESLITLGRLEMGR
jgi:hypothetical protein